MKLARHIASLILTSISVGSQAAELPEHFHPVRPNAAGGAATAIANDENAVWTNPGGIARIRKARSRSSLHIIKIPNLILGANSKSKEFIEGISGSANEDNISKAVDQAEELGDKPFWSVASTFPMVMMDFGGLPTILGFYSHTTLKAVVDQNNPENARTEAISDAGGVLGFAFDNRTNRFNLGFNLRYFSRYAYEENVPLTILADAREMQTRIKTSSNKTTAFAVDAGMMFTLADFWFPTIGLAVYNLPTGCKQNYLNPFSKKRETVCGTTFSGDFGNDEALSTVDPTDIRVGFSITPRLGRKFAVRISLDLHHLSFTSGDQSYGLSEVPIQKQLHAGAEFFVGNPLLPPPLSVSIGLSQGYYTMGASLRISFLSLDFATFGRDISSSDTPIEDRRIMGGLSIDF